MLDNGTFAAWSCSKCNWILSNPGPGESGRPSAKVVEEFKQQECAKFPRR